MFGHWYTKIELPTAVQRPTDSPGRDSSELFFFIPGHFPCYFIVMVNNIL